MQTSFDPFSFFKLMMFIVPQPRKLKYCTFEFLFIYLFEMKTDREGEIEIPALQHRNHGCPKRQLTIPCFFINH